MLFLAGSFMGLQVGLFIFVCFVFAGTIWLYRSSMQSLKKQQEEQRQQYSHLIEAVDAERNRHSWAHRFSKSIQSALAKEPIKEQPAKAAAADVSLSLIDLLAVKQMLAQQQQLSQQLLAQIEQLQVPPVAQKSPATQEARRRVEELEIVLEEKEETIRQLLAQQKLADNKLGAKLEQVQQDLLYMQERMKALEHQAAQASRLAVELDESQVAYQQLFSDLSRKNEKLQQVVQDNNRLQEQLTETEDKLQEANTQRQQLLKKVQLLEVSHTELQTLSDTNKKLQTELRRIGELESMLNMIIEERNQLLRK